MSPQSDVGLDPGSVPRHIAIIMDGNGRWARKRFLPRVEGHRTGGKVVRAMVETCRRLGVRYLTLFAFSTENFQRPAEEVGALMRLFVHYLEAEVPRLKEHGVRLRTQGDLTRLPPDLAERFRQAERETEHLTGMDLIIAVAYGGRLEIVSAARKIAERVRTGEILTQDITEDLFARSLFLPDVPDPELLIRTSDEFRISNFLLWEIAYAELVVTPVLWPDFTEAELHRCIHEFNTRSRRFGRTEEQGAE